MQGDTFMASLTMDVETASHAPRNRRLEQWVEEVAQLCKPDRVHWCDGSQEEYQSMLRLMTLSGTQSGSMKASAQTASWCARIPPTWRAWKTAPSSAPRPRKKPDPRTTGKIR